MSIVAVVFVNVSVIVASVVGGSVAPVVIVVVAEADVVVVIVLFFFVFVFVFVFVIVLVVVFCKFLLRTLIIMKRTRKCSLDNRCYKLFNGRKVGWS